ncbi:MAG: hypothetical protein HZA54_05715 [Planctomycetes bacterium]|nr:hypothetical protein [Planctomycetota bacterium]
MSPDQIATWAASGESETLEFKRTTGERREATRTRCAMLNHRGGRVRMAELTRQAGLPQLESEDAGGCVTVRFRPSRYLPLQRVRREITARQQAILALLDEAPRGLALREIHARVGATRDERQVREELAILRLLGLAIPSGHGRGARWKRL